MTIFSTKSLLFVATTTTLLASTTTNAFVVKPNTATMTTTASTPTSSPLNMGLFDFFSPEEKEKRERKRRAQVEEQERLQKAIMERRKNPDLMEEYEYKTQLRREMKMKGEWEAAKNVDVFSNADGQTLLDGTSNKEE